jgi:hypothetical protein
LNFKFYRWSRRADYKTHLYCSSIPSEVIGMVNLEAAMTPVITTFQTGLNKSLE